MVHNERMVITKPLDLYPGIYSVNCKLFEDWGLLLVTEINWSSIGIWAWMSNYIHVKQWYAVTGPYPANFNGVSVEPLNTLKPRQNGRHFADDTFKCIVLNENVWIPITIWLGFVPKGSINNIPALVQIMVWRRPGDKPLSEPLMVILPTHICVTRPQWVKLEHRWIITPHWK